MTELAPSSQKNSIIWIVVGSALICLAILITLVVLYIKGFVVGQEFSPDDFTQRSFYYNKTPGLGWVIPSKKIVVDVTSDLAKSLVRDGLITPTHSPNPTWHLLYDSGTMNSEIPPPECNARLLTAYFDLVNEDHENYWESWNQQFPKSARVFWPIVADRARHNDYLIMPDIMTVAMELQSDDPDHLQKQLRSILDNRP